jgi:hypothetical protein
MGFGIRPAKPLRDALVVPLLSPPVTEGLVDPSLPFPPPTGLEPTPTAAVENGDVPDESRFRSERWYPDDASGGSTAREDTIVITGSSLKVTKLSYLVMVL